jgi:hypothetical protein
MAATIDGTATKIAILAVNQRFSKGNRRFSDTKPKGFARNLASRFQGLRLGTGARRSAGPR